MSSESCRLSIATEARRTQSKSKKDSLCSLCLCGESKTKKPPRPATVCPAAADHPPLQDVVALTGTDCAAKNFRVKGNVRSICARVRTNAIAKKPRRDSKQLPHGFLAPLRSFLNLNHVMNAKRQGGKGKIRLRYFSSPRLLPCLAPWLLGDRFLFYQRVQIPPILKPKKSFARGVHDRINGYEKRAGVEPGNLKSQRLNLFFARVTSAARGVSG